MKNSLLIALAALTAVSANAQLSAQKYNGSKVQAQMTKMIGQAQLQTAEQAQPGQVLPKKAKKVGANAAKYYRPQGTFYVNWDDAGYGYVMPYLLVKPFQNYEFKNVSTGNMDGSSWTYSVWNSETNVRDTVDFAGQDFTYRYGHELQMTPLLTLSNGSDYSVTRGVRLNSQTGAVEAGPFNGSVAAVTNFSESATPSEEASFFVVSPHYYGSSSRDMSNKYGWTYYSGAPGPDYNADDENPDRSGYWFGRNWGGTWNAFAIAVEQPTDPYILKHVVAWATGIKGTAEFDLTCKVYRLEELPAGDDAEGRASIDPAQLDDAHLIASGTYTVGGDLFEEQQGLMTFDLEEYDPDLDMYYQVTPEINFPILVVINGYDCDACQGFSFLVTSDDEYEGWGETVFQCSMRDGAIVYCEGLNNFFTSGEMHRGGSIFLDIDLPFLIANLQGEPGEYTFPNEGGDYTYANYGYLNLYASGEDTKAADVEWTLEDGSDVPEWLTLVANDVTEGQLEGSIDVKATAAALPQGVTYREANVVFSIFGARMHYTFKQGEQGETPSNPYDVTGDGNVDLADINAVINVMLKKAENAKADVNGDGQVDLADINAIINKMLGK